MKSILEFEEKYKDILPFVNDWNFVRTHVGEYLHNSDNREIKNQYKKMDKIRNRSTKFLKSVKHMFYGFKNWFGKYDYIFITDSSQRKLINGYYYHTQFDYIIDSLNMEKCLLIEEPNEKHYHNSFTKYIVSYSLIEMVSLLIPINKKYFIEKETIDRLLKLENINIKINYILRHYKSKMILLKWLFLLYKPKILFVSCGYCKMDFVKVAKEFGILVIEVQHGVVNKAHFSYRSLLPLNPTYYPDIFLSWGLKETKIKNFLIPNVYPVGSYYLEYIKENFQKNEKLNDIIELYNLVIGVTMQDQDWEFYTLRDALQDLAQQFTHVIFIIIPRRREDFNFKEENIMVWKETDCYQTIMHCDIHLTLYSTCAIEVPSLGIPNLLLNHNNMAQVYYGDILSSENTTIGDIKLLKKKIKEFSCIKSDDIVETNRKNFVVGYKDNIIEILQKKGIKDVK